MTAECRPPVGTPDGASCFLDRWTQDDPIKTVWSGGKHYWPHATIDGHAPAYTPESLAAAGWRFHSLATPPEDKP